MKYFYQMKFVQLIIKQKLKNNKYVILKMKNKQYFIEEICIYIYII